MSIIATPRKGRKPYGERSLTAAERKRNQRAREKAMVAEFVAKPPVVEQPPAPVIPPPQPAAVIDLPEPRPSHVRKQRSDSVTAEIAAAIQGDKPELMPPAHLFVPLEGLTDWRSIIASRNRDDWTHGELIQVGVLVKHLLKMRMHTEILETEGDLVHYHLGRVAINPRFSLVDSLHKQILALMKSLNITTKRTTQPGGGGRVFSGSSDDPDGLLA